MPSVCLYFQLHQPYRLRRYSVFDTDRHYFDDFKNAELLHTIAQRSYLPANKLMLELVNQHRGAFKLAYSISGVLLDQLEARAPDVIDGFKKLAQTGCVEFLAETYYHSLTYVTSPAECRAQIEQHRDRVARLFGAVPKTFRNTELIYDNGVAAMARDLGFETVLLEGVDAVLGTRTCNAVYTPAGRPIDGAGAAVVAAGAAPAAGLKLLPRNYRLSDDIAFRFSDKAWPPFPLTAGKFAQWVGQIDGDAAVCGLFMDYEAIGEHQWKETGIFDFLADLPRALLALPGTDFVTPAQAATLHPPAAGPAGVLDVPRQTSWADTERDLSAWTGNAMQANALGEWKQLEAPLHARHDPGLLEDWRKLGTSDHFYYMSTKFWADGQVHRYFSPYESPYDAYINFMNVLDNIKSRVRAA